MEAAEADRIIGPQPGPQTDFLTTIADIAIYGGAAGGGKTFGLLLEPIRHYENPLFDAVCFRRNTTQVRNKGGLWDEAGKLYPLLGATLKDTTLEVTFPSGMGIKFAHLEYETTVYDWQGAQIPLIMFDELTHFTENQFFYMMSRNRSTSGVAGYIRATCNPDADSWVKKMISWWIDPKTGLPIKERAGKLRWFIRVNDELIWADSSEEIHEKYGRGPDILPKSLTFIPSTIQDNKILMAKDPSYLANLNALARVERLRLLGGDWNIRPASGLYFTQRYFSVVDAIPAGGTAIRYWDRASTKPNEKNKDPDYTVGLKLIKYPNGQYIVADVIRFQDSPGEVEKSVKRTATHDGYGVHVGIEQDPGQAGVADKDNYVKLLAGYSIKVNRVTEDKITRALPVSGQAEHGNILVLRAPWNDDFFKELTNFPPEKDKGHDDQVDAFSGAFNELVKIPADDWSPISITGVNKFA